MYKRQVLDYSQYVSGVDKTDGQMEAYCIAGIRVKKYYFKLFMHLVDIVCFNTFNYIKKQVIWVDYNS